MILECFVDGKAVPAVFHKEDMNTFPQLEAIIDTFKDLVATLPQWVECNSVIIQNSSPAIRSR